MHYILNGLTINVHADVRQAFYVMD